MQENYTIYYKI